MMVCTIILSYVLIDPSGQRKVTLFLDEKGYEQRRALLSNPKPNTQYQKWKVIKTDKPFPCYKR